MEEQAEITHTTWDNYKGGHTTSFFVKNHHVVDVDDVVYGVQLEDIKRIIKAAYLYGVIVATPVEIATDDDY